MGTSGLGGVGVRKFGTLGTGTNGTGLMLGPLKNAFRLMTLQVFVARMLLRKRILMFCVMIAL